MPVSYDPPISATQRQPLWPFATALALLLAAGAGLVITIARGDDQPLAWYTNPWFWLGSLTLLTLCLSVALFFTRRRLGRRMQTALVVSLVLHVMLAIYLKDQVLELILDDRNEPTLAHVEPQPTMPSYYLAAPNQSRPTQPFERPSEASFDGQLSQLDRTQPAQTVDAQQASSDFAAPSAAVPTDIPLQPQPMSAPREAHRQSLMRRQEKALVQRPDQPIPSPRSAELDQPQRDRDPPSPTMSEYASRGRPASRPRRAAAATASHSAMTRGNAGDGALLPRAARPTTAAAGSAQASSQQSRLRVGAATANRLAERPIQVPPESQSAASPATLAPAPTIGPQSQLARSATAGSSSHGREGTTRLRENAGDVWRAEISRIASSRSSGTSRDGRLTHGDEASSVTGRDRSGPSRRQVAAQIGDANALGESSMLAEARTDTDHARRGPLLQRDAVSSDAHGDTNGHTAAPTSGSLARLQAALPTRVAAPVGVGGLGTIVAANAGLQDRRASPRSRIAHQAPSRFLGRTSGSPPSRRLADLGSQSRRAAAPFAGRVARRRAQEPGTSDDNSVGAPSERTEATIERGLAYLARVQHEDGRWSLQAGADETQPTPLINADSAATGLSLLAFLGAGYDHFDGNYREQVAAGLRWLVEHQRPSGDLYHRQEGPANQGIWLYSHGIAAIALCEAYGMTGDEQLKAPAQKSLEFIIAAQHPTYGGWRYAPGETPDLSVSGWQLMALRSGQLAGLHVPADTIAGVRRLLETASAGQAQFAYNPWSNHPRQANVDRSPNSVMTSVGLLMRLYSGSGRHDAEIQQGAALLAERLPNATKSLQTRSMKNPNRDAYYWYNATQVMFHMQGERWESWRQALYPLLAESQEITGTHSGSWDPFGPAPDRWARHAGRLYVTAMNLLSLEVYYRHLPLYEDGVAARD